MASAISVGDGTPVTLPPRTGRTADSAGDRARARRSPTPPATAVRRAATPCCCASRWSPSAPPARSSPRRRRRPWRSPSGATPWRPGCCCRSRCCAAAPSCAALDRRELRLAGARRAAARAALRDLDPVAELHHGGVARRRWSRPSRSGRRCISGLRGRAGRPPGLDRHRRRDGRRAAAHRRRPAGERRGAARRPARAGRRGVRRGVHGGRQRGAAQRLDDHLHAALLLGDRAAAARRLRRRAAGARRLRRRGLAEARRPSPPARSCSATRCSTRSCARSAPTVVSLAAAARDPRRGAHRRGLPRPDAAAAGAARGGAAARRAGAGHPRAAAAAPSPACRSSDARGAARPRWSSSAEAVRDDVLAACRAQTVEQLSAYDDSGAGDTAFAVDRVSEERLRRAGRRPAGAPGRRGRRRTHEADAEWTLLADPLDGTRPLAHQKRSAWVLLGATRGRTLGDLEVSVAVEVPTVKAGWADVLSAVRGAGARGERVDLRDGSRAPPCRSRPAGRPASSRATAGSRATSPAPGRSSPRSTTPCTGACWGRPAPARRRPSRTSTAPAAPSSSSPSATTGGPPTCARCSATRAGICAHPYDLAGWLVAAEAGVHVVRPDGGPLDAPLDLTSDVAWAAYANDAVRALVEPALQAELRERGLLPGVPPAPGCGTVAP